MMQGVLFCVLHPIPFQHTKPPFQAIINITHLPNLVKYDLVKHDLLKQVSLTFDSSQGCFSMEFVL